jgi:hypothetical protein
LRTAGSALAISSKRSVDLFNAGAAEPQANRSMIGLAFYSALAVTIIRVGFGAFPLGSSLFAWSCLLSTRRLLTELGFVATMIGVALLVRVFGMLGDATVPENMRLVRAEIAILVIVTIDFLLEFGRRRQQLHTTGAEEAF